MKHSDTDIGTTSWFEATAESIFSVFEMVIHDRESLTVGHTVVTCRILTNGPKQGFPHGLVIGLVGVGVTPLPAL